MLPLTECHKNAHFLHDSLEDFLVVATVVCPATGEARPEAAATLQLQVGVATLQLGQVDSSRICHFRTGRRIPGQGRTFVTLAVLGYYQF